MLHKLFQHSSSCVSMAKWRLPRKLSYAMVPPASLFLTRKAAQWRLRYEQDQATAAAPEQHHPRHHTPDHDQGEGYGLPGGSSNIQKGGSSSSTRPPGTWSCSSNVTSRPNSPGGVYQQDQENFVQKFDLINIAERCNIMGTSKLDYSEIRKWHQARGYLGGIVVRQLDNMKHSNDTVETGDRTAFGKLMDDAFQAISAYLPANFFEKSPFNFAHLIPEELQEPKKIKMESFLFDKLANETESMRRECYYLYYEMCGKTGDRTYEVFIRGTLIWSDWWRNLNFRKVWDTELEKYIHAGFLRKSDILLNDLEPLLQDRHGKIRLHGHSLGGAMAEIIGLKLEKRGFYVEQVTSFGAPKFLTCCLGDNSTLGATAEPEVVVLEEQHDKKEKPSSDFITITAANDPVPYMPIEGPASCWFKGWYVSYGKRFHLEDSGSHDVSAESHQQPDKQNYTLFPFGSFLHWLQNSFLVVPFSNPDSHRLKHYIKLLEDEESRFSSVADTDGADEQRKKVGAETATSSAQEVAVAPEDRGLQLPELQINSSEEGDVVGIKQLLQQTTGDVPPSPPEPLPRPAAHEVLREPVEVTSKSGALQ
ncbi:unnamed protein product [Amoebophrya sp. A120]|nr:unnamed protein product [Amoebophrya sp. A120]|eukprot:GSA120T00006748001.1